MTTYQIRSPLAMCACAISGSLSILLLVEPSFNDGFTHRLIVPVAVSIGLVSMAIITGVLAHGHGLWTASGAALALVSVGLSGAIVWEQSGRRAQTRVTTQVVVVDATKERARLTKLRAEADQILTAHRAAQARECASGKGKRCDGISYTVRTWEAALEGYDAKLRGVPAPTPDAKVETISTAAELLGKDAKTARAWVSLIDPLLVPLLLELAAILCGVVAFGPRVAEPSAVAPVSKPGSTGNSQETAHSAHVLRFCRSTEESRETRHASPLKVETDEARILRALKAKGGKIGSQDELGIVVGVSKGEVSKMLRNCPNVERIRIDNKNVIRIRDAG